MTKSQKIKAILFAIWAEVVFFAILILLVSIGLVDNGHPILSKWVAYAWYFGFGFPGVGAYGYMAHRYKKTAIPA